MGKWSNAHFDGILCAKMKTLVSGAIERSKLEKTQSNIKYEELVTFLDAGDSFTTSLIDILVQELADRLSRQEEKDKGFIADKTAKNLKLLAAPYRIYRSTPNPRAHRRSVNLTDYLHVPPNALDVEEDSDSFEWFDTARLSMPESDSVHSSTSQIYESLTPWINPNMASQAREGSPDRQGEPVPVSPTFRSFDPVPRAYPLSHSTWVSSPPAGLSSTTAIRRSHSLRRPLRARASDFSDFTSRRRSTAREALQNQSHPAEEISEAAPRDAPTGDASYNRDRDGSLPAVRRFFSLGGSRLRHSSRGSPPPPWSELPSIQASSTQPSRADLGQSPSPPPRNSSPFIDSLPPLPRLRRGGLRAPESMLSGHASPVSAIPPSERTSAPPELVVPLNPPPPAEYPTPTSTDNE